MNKHQGSGHDLLNGAGRPRVVEHLQHGLEWVPPCLKSSRFGQHGGTTRVSQRPSRVPPLRRSTVVVRVCKKLLDLGPG